MSASTSERYASTHDGRDSAPRASAMRRGFTETKASFKTSEFFAMIGVIVAILIAAASIGATAGHPDRFTGSQAWLYVSIVAVGYMISRGLAKSGSREPYPEDRR